LALQNCFLCYFSQIFTPENVNKLVRTVELIRKPGILIGFLTVTIIRTSENQLTHRNRYAKSIMETIDNLLGICRMNLVTASVLGLFTVGTFVAYSISGRSWFFFFFDAFIYRVSCI
jgi:hypothetical protein